MYVALHALAVYVRFDPNCLQRAAAAPVMQLASGRIASIDELMAKHDPILLFASRLLPAATVSDASALYAWCRRLDEIVDGPSARGDPSGTQARLDDWQRRFDALCHGSPADEMDAALAACLHRHPSLGRQPFDDMIAGMRSDAVESRRMGSLAELEEYAYRVAGTVGLMLLPLLKGEAGAARAPAIALGRAIQLVNILRDATADASLGRIYLPRELMSAHGVDETDVLALRCTDGYRSAVAALADRAASLLAEADAGRASLPGVGPLFVQVIIELYRDYLVELERRGFDNLSAAGERVRIGPARKLLAAVRAAGTVLTRR
jgi:phytoene synthase